MAHDECSKLKNAPNGALFLTFVLLSPRLDDIGDS